jgi:hypothetical protein
MNVTLILSDFVEVAEGKLYILGGGWTFKGQGTPMGVGIIIEVPWDATNRVHSWTLRLVDADGQAVRAPFGEGGGQPVVVEGQVDVGWPAGHPSGTPLNVPLGINFGPIPLPPGQRFTFVLEVDGEPAENGQVSFSTHPSPPARS